MMMIFIIIIIIVVAVFVIIIIIIINTLFQDGIRCKKARPNDTQCMYSE